MKFTYIDRQRRPIRAPAPHTQQSRILMSLDTLGIKAVQAPAMELNIIDDAIQALAAPIRAKTSRSLACSSGSRRCELWAAPTGFTRARSHGGRAR